MTAKNFTTRVGEFVLDSNPENYFAEIEQAAFEPSNLVPEIDPLAFPRQADRGQRSADPSSFIE